MHSIQSNRSVTSNRFSTEITPKNQYTYEVDKLTRTPTFTKKKDESPKKEQTINRIAQNDNHHSNYQYSEFSDTESLFTVQTQLNNSHFDMPLIEKIRKYESMMDQERTVHEQAIKSIESLVWVF